MALTRSLSSGNSIMGRAANLKVLFWSITQHGISTSGQDLAIKESSSIRRYAEYTIFKGKAAFSLSPVLPSIQKTKSSRVYKNGCVILTFWPAIGVRKYDWQKKQAFALSPAEVGSLIALGPAESCEFFLDPSKMSSHEGKVLKTLAITPVSKDNGYFVNLSVVNNVLKTNERFSVPVTKAEFAVIRTVSSYVLPYIMGWPQAVNPQPLGIIETKSQNQPIERPDPAHEWER